MQQLKPKWQSILIIIALDGIWIPYQADMLPTELSLLGYIPMFSIQALTVWSKINTLKSPLFYWTSSTFFVSRLIGHVNVEPDFPTDSDRLERSDPQWLAIRQLLQNKTRPVLKPVQSCWHSSDWKQFDLSMVHLCYPFKLCYSKCRFSTGRIKHRSRDLCFMFIIFGNKVLLLQKYKLDWKPDRTRPWALL